MSGRTLRYGYVLNHGYGGYTHGCSCETCRKAKAEYVAARRNAGLEQNGHGQIPRCSSCGYLTTTQGHRNECGVTS